MILGFIGSGKMAGALVEGVAKAGVIAPECMLVCDVMMEAAEKLAASTGARIAATTQELVAAADTVVLCVKPGDAMAALQAVDTGDKLVISIVAGLKISELQQGAPNARIIRVMPNTPALVHRGATAYAMGKTAREKDAQTTERIFGAVGTIARVKEELLDVVTGLSGSGPAYVYLVIEALADGGVLMGLPRDLASQLATQTVLGAAEMVSQTGNHPAVLRDMVTSPGGTTIAGLEALERCGVRAAFLSAVRSATERARELGTR